MFEGDKCDPKIISEEYVEYFGEDIITPVKVFFEYIICSDNYDPESVKSFIEGVDLNLPRYKLENLGTYEHNEECATFRVSFSKESDLYDSSYEFQMPVQASNSQVREFFKSGNCPKNWAW